MTAQVFIDGQRWRLTKHGKARFYERIARKNRTYTDEEIIKLMKDHPLAVWESDHVINTGVFEWRLVTVLSRR